MLGKYRLLTLSAIIAVLIPCLPYTAGAFELFPRPLGSLRKSATGEIFNQRWIQRGESTFSLSRIAGDYYGDPTWWPFLWNQNPGLQVKGTGPAQDQSLAPSVSNMWLSGRKYNKKDVVSHMGHVYVAISQNTGDASTEPGAGASWKTYWAPTGGTRLNLYDAPHPYTVQNQSYTPPTGLPDDVRFLVTKIPYQGIPYDKHYFRYKLSLRPTQVWGYIAAAPEDYKVHYLERDLVYISFRPSKRQAVLVGDRFGIYRERGPIGHPLNPDRPIGFMSEIIGEVEVTSVGHELATAIILDSYVEIVKGDKICLFTPRTREIVPTKVHRLLTGTILVSATRNDVFYVDSHNLENDIVFIDRGECDGMAEGMLLNIYRPSHPVSDPFFHRPIATPDRFVGEGVILKAFDKNSTMLITRSREEIVPGDIIKSVSD